MANPGVGHDPRRIDYAACLAVRPTTSAAQSCRVPCSAAVDSPWQCSQSAFDAVKPKSSRQQRLVCTITEEVAVIIFLAKKTARSKQDRLASRLAAEHGITAKAVRDIWSLRTWWRATEPYWTTDDHARRSDKHGTKGAAPRASRAVTTQSGAAAPSAAAPSGQSRQRARASRTARRLSRACPLPHPAALASATACAAYTRHRAVGRAPHRALSHPLTFAHNLPDPPVLPTTFPLLQTPLGTLWLQTCLRQAPLLHTRWPPDPTLSRPMLLRALLPRPDASCGTFRAGAGGRALCARNRQAAENSSANTAGDLRGEMSAPEPMSKLDLLAHAALLTDEMENGSIRRGRKEENAEEADAGTQVSREGAAQAASRARCETLRERLRKLEEELRKLEEELPVRESRITSLQGQQQARARGSSEQAAGGCRD